MKPWLGFSALLLAAACSSTGPVTQPSAGSGGGQQQGYYKVGNPYEINGVTYVPKFDPTYDETGIASWYAGGFNGEKTANGELYDSDQLTAAHRTLPLPSLVRVTNLDNGRALILRVNDRGPFSRARIIDVSKRAAQLLGFEGKGTAKVRVQIMVKESEALADAARRGDLATTVADAIETNAPPTATPAPGQTQLAANDRSVSASPLADQIGGIQVVDEAAVIKQETGVQPKGQDEDGRFLPAQKVQTEKVVHTGIYIQAGAFSSQDNANRLKDRLQKYAATVEPVTINGQSLVSRACWSYKGCAECGRQAYANRTVRRTRGENYCRVKRSISVQKFCRSFLSSLYCRCPPARRRIGTTRLLPLRLLHPVITVPNGLAAPETNAKKRLHGRFRYRPRSIRQKRRRTYADLIDEQDDDDLSCLRSA